LRPKLKKKISSAITMPYTKPGTWGAPITFTQIATHGATPAMVPNQKGSIVVDVRPGGFIRSCSQPNRIMATFAPTTASSAAMSVMPL
jgi:hypothetical protein